RRIGRAVAKADGRMYFLRADRTHADVDNRLQILASDPDAGVALIGIVKEWDAGVQTFEARLGGEKHKTWFYDRRYSHHFVTAPIATLSNLFGQRYFGLYDLEIEGFVPVEILGFTTEVPPAKHKPRGKKKPERGGVPALRAPHESRQPS